MDSGFLGLFLISPRVPEINGRRTVCSSNFEGQNRSNKFSSSVLRASQLCFVFSCCSIEYKLSTGLSDWNWLKEDPTVIFLFFFIFFPIPTDMSRKKQEPGVFSLSLLLLSLAFERPLPAQKAVNKREGDGRKKTRRNQEVNINYLWNSALRNKRDGLWENISQVICSTTQKRGTS